MELFAWGKGFGLPSFDPFCLSIEALLNLVQVKWVVIEANSNASPTGELPVLKIQTEPIAGTSNIIKVLKQRGHDLDHTLSKLELYESQALICMIEDKLHDALV
jgi:metaxin